MPDSSSVPATTLELRSTVTDDGTNPASLSDSETFTITVNEVNVNPVLGAIGNKTVDELNLLSFTATASDSDIPANTLTFSLAGTVPAGASITSGGLFTWTPTEVQGPGMYTFDVVVTDNGAPNLTDSETITVTVRRGGKDVDLKIKWPTPNRPGAEDLPKPPHGRWSGQARP